MNAVITVKSNARRDLGEIIQSMIAQGTREVSGKDLHIKIDYGDDAEKQAAQELADALVKMQERIDEQYASAQRAIEEVQQAVAEMSRGTLSHLKVEESTSANIKNINLRLDGVRADLDALTKVVESSRADKPVAYLHEYTQSVGSTYARDLCRKHGLDPDETRGGP